jgi:hypothetical protein
VREGRIRGVVRSTWIVAVTGGRDYSDELVIHRALREQIALAVDRLGLEPVLLTGGCPTGADEIARKFWHRAQRPYVVVPAKFTSRGRGAGPSRNKAMAIGAALHMDPPLHPDVLLRFPGGRGTEDCAEHFQAMGVKIVECGVERALT